ncbi:MAG TPA: nicotinamide-nucleotide amidohydrolase family protein [Bacilli bacterium]|jgi:nicotinamide-nucleotide amidase|nr:nicotinamide-nucleotide amidohydrolase family protein [Acholeplasmataceae bacterium]HPX83427.1 nicotinamide-nucleotide amidohydrolase family protein [Bacilli bacterium]HQB80039.1 nicotinamide-nucleotide amidohydrolase family protein [Bacilli bacterium]
MIKFYILVVGDEVLDGLVVDTNSLYLQEKIQSTGNTVLEIRKVRDESKAISNAVLDFLESNADILVCFGGLGPTYDDQTKQAIASSLNKNLSYYEEAKKTVLDYFKKSPYAKADEQQFYYPEGSKLIANPNGTAMGMAIEVKGKTIIALPGPPKENKPMIESLISKYFLKDKKYQKTFLVTGMEESKFEDKVTSLRKNVQDVGIISYPTTGYIRYIIKSYNKDAYNKVVLEFKELLKEYIFGEENMLPEEKLVKLLKEKKLTITAAESMTGGMFISKLINVPGSSSVVLESYITYADSSKAKILGIDLTLIEKYGVVSKEVAKEMVLGLSKISSADIKVSVTGIAGPSGGSKDLPIGSVWFGIMINDELYLYNDVFSGDRNLIREKASVRIMYYLIKLLENKN